MKNSLTSSLSQTSLAHFIEKWCAEISLIFIFLFMLWIRMRAYSLYFFNQRGNSGNYEVPLLAPLLSGLRASGVSTTGLHGAEAAYTYYIDAFSLDAISSGSLLINGDLLVSGTV